MSNGPSGEGDHFQASFSQETKSNTRSQTAEHHADNQQCREFNTGLLVQPSPTEPTVDFHAFIKHKRKLFSRCLVVSHGLLLGLKSVDFIRDKLKHRQGTTDITTDELLNILVDIPNDQQQLMFSCLLAALRDDGQEHVANIFHRVSDEQPMSDERYQLLLKKREELTCTIDPTYSFMCRLVRDGVLDESDMENIMKKINCSEVLIELTNILLHRPDSAFDKFIEALKATHQQHVVYILTGEGHERPMGEERRQLLQNNMEELLQSIHPTGVFLSILLGNGVLNQDNMDRITSISSYSEMSSQLVNILQRKPDSAFGKFIDALYSTDQHHVVYTLTGEGDERPLSRIQRKVLIEARSDLVRIIEIRHGILLAELLSNGVLNEADLMRIETEQTSLNKTSVLIDAVARKSQSAYIKFIQAFKHQEIGQPYVALLLEGLELNGYLKAKFKSNTEKLKRSEIIKKVREELKGLIDATGDAIKELTTLLEHNWCALYEVSEGSIRISFRCFTKESVINFQRLYSDKTLDKLFTKVLCPEFADEGLESLELHIADEEFVKCAETARDIEEEMSRESSELDSTVEEQTSQQPTTSLTATGFSVQPVELLELVLLRTFTQLFTDYYKSRYKTHEAIPLAYSSLAAVCYNWWQTMHGWEHSTTKHWFRHKLHRALKFVCRPYVVSPHLPSSVKLPAPVRGVTVCGNKLFVVCQFSNSILVFGQNNEPQTSIERKQLESPRDIVSCTETQQLFVADESRDSTRCVWRVSLDGRQVEKWLPNKSTTTGEFKPHTLSVTSRRLLVTSYDNNELLLYDPDGVELRRVPLPNLTSLRHAVETSRGTFIVCHNEPQPRVCEVNVDGRVIRVYCDQQQLSTPTNLSLDSDGRIFVVDYNKHRILLLNSETLELERVLLDRQQHQLTEFPWRLCYTQQTGQLAVCGSVKDVLTGGWVSCCVQLFTVR